MTPKMIGHYEIQALLGSGGIGHVYAALDQDLGRSVAIKALRPEFSRDPSFVERFRAEAASLARLNHPNVTTLFALHREAQEVFMVMELVRGQTLEALLGQVRRLGARECLAVIAQTAAGLSYAHRMGVIHRDIKPSNLMLTDTGLLKIMDFGIARVRGSERLTREGSIVGTLAYVAPEQVKGGEGDERSDLYSLACVLYEMLSGDPPFRSESEYELIRAQVEQRPEPLSVRPKGLDQKTERVLMRALNKNPLERFASLDEFSHELGAAAVQGEAPEILRNTVRTSAARPAETKLVAQPNLQAAAANAPDSPATPRVVSGTVAAAGAKSNLPLGKMLAVAGIILALGLGYGGYMMSSSTGTEETAHKLTDAPKPLAASVGSTETPGQPSVASLPEPPRGGPEAAVREAGNAPDARAVPPPVPPAQVATAAAPDLPPSTTILPAANALKPNREFPALPPRIAGPVRSYSAGGWPVIGGQTARLAGIDVIDSGKIPRVTSWIKAHGDVLECEPVDASSYRCLTPQKLDLAEAVLLNGAARATPGADRIYREAEDRAREARRGVWQ